jgi:hypothetical protein
MDTNEVLEGIDKSLDNARGISILKQAARKRDERENTLFLDVPTWDGDLVCEYRVVDSTELGRVAEAAVRRMRQNGKVEPAANDIALIVAASVGLWAVDPDSGERVQIEDQFGHVGYDRIHNVLGRDDIHSNADAVKYLMGDKNDDGTWTVNVIAITMHAQKIQQWMRDPSKRSIGMEELLGEL